MKRALPMLSKRRLLFAVLLFCAIASSLYAGMSLQPVNAADAKNFDPGHIIDDSVFYNGSAMSASQIQTFLNSKVPVCDTNGTQSAADWGYPNITHAQLAEYKRNGTNGFSKDTGFHAPPYVCLKDFKQNTPQMEATSGLCGSLPAYSNRTAAQIIKDVAMACGINPQVLIVLLHKEQSLVTDTWPLQRQYRSATGFACPDTAPCNPSYNGFFYQVYHAARQFKVYKAFPNDYNYIAGRNNNIYWHPDLARCGSSQVYIQNQATAALYIYTPYRPNQAALNNMYGTGDSCSSYGNRNFWRLFTDWFGPTTGPQITSTGLLLYGWDTNDDITAVFYLKNVSRSSLNIDYIRVRAVNENGDQYLFTPKDNLVLKPGESYRYEQSVQIDKEGTYTFYMDRKVGSSWVSPPFSDLGFSGVVSLSRTIAHEPTVTTSLEVNKPVVHVNEPVTASFDVSNSSAIKPTNVGLLKVEGFDSNGNQYQFGATDDNLTLAPGAAYAYNSTASFNKPGTVTLEIINRSPNIGWNKTYPVSSTSGITRKVNLNIKDQVTLTEGLTINQTNIREGDTVTATFKIKNFGTTAANVGLLKVEAFDASGRQYQFGATDDNLTLAPGQEYTYSKNLALNNAGSYNFRITNKHPQVGWNKALPAPETSGLARQVNVNVQRQTNLTSSLSITPASATAGSTFTASFKIRNFGTTAANVGLLKVEAFDASGRQYQFDSTDDNLGLSPNQEYTYSKSLVLSRKGTYTFRIVNNHPQTGWNHTLPQSQSSSILRTQTITVN